jgi:hypothetical protein
MADPMSIAGMGMTAMGGITSAMGKKTEAAGAQTQIAGSMISTIAKAFGMEVEAKQYDYQSMVADYQAKVDQINEATARENANYERDTADRKVEQSEMKARYEEGAAKAAQGASGIDINSGSSTNVRESMIELGAYDAATIRADGARKAYAFDVEAMQDEAQSRLHTFASEMNKTQAADTRTAAGLTRMALPLQQQAMSLAGTSGDIGVMGSLLSAGTSLASKWTTGKGWGMFTGGE